MFACIWKKRWVLCLCLADPQTEPWSQTRRQTDHFCDLFSFLFLSLFSCRKQCKRLVHHQSLVVHTGLPHDLLHRFENCQTCLACAVYITGAVTHSHQCALQTHTFYSNWQHSAISLMRAEFASQLGKCSRQCARRSEKHFHTSRLNTGNRGKMREREENSSKGRKADQDT